MDIAVFSDIHANYVAFRRCLEMALERKIETFLFLGDYLGEFPYPQKTMEMLYELQKKYPCYFVRGNKEDYWLKKKDSGAVWKAGTSSSGSLYYTYSNLTEKDMTFFAGQPLTKELRIEGQEPILLCHGSPEKNNEKLLPADEHTEEMLAKVEQKYILCGHSHIQRTFECMGKQVWNPGAVGVSCHSGGKAQFMILHSKGKEWECELMETDYDKDQVIADIKASELDRLAPCWTKITIHLIQTGEVMHAQVLLRAVELCREETGDCNWQDIPERYWEKAVQEMIG